MNNKEKELFEQLKRDLLKGLEEALGGSGISRRWVLAHIIGVIEMFISDYYVYVGDNGGQNEQ